MKTLRSTIMNLQRTGKDMPRYNVLITINQYIEISAVTPEDAELEAYRAFKHGEILIDQSPIFICEEEDLIKEDEDAKI